MSIFKKRPSCTHRWFIHVNVVPKMGYQFKRKKLDNLILLITHTLRVCFSCSVDKLVNNRHNLLHHKKPVHSQAAAGHGVIGSTVIATSTNPQVSQIYATHLLKPGNLLIGKPSNKFAVPQGSLTLNVASLGMSGVGQQPTLYIASNEDMSQQQVVSSPSHMT